MSKLVHIPIDQLQTNPFQPREKIKTEDIQDLAKSIKNHGVLEPLVIAQTPAGYQIIAGERRWRASRLAGLTKVPAIIKKTSPKGMLEMALIENIQRDNLGPMERAQALQQLENEFRLNLEQIADRIGKSSSYVSNTLGLLRLPDAVKDGLAKGLITEGHARALKGLASNKITMVQVYNMLIAENASVRKAEELVRKFKEREEAKSKKKDNLYQLEDKQIKQWQSAWRSYFNQKTDLKITRSQRHTRITFTIKGKPAKTQADLEKIMKIINK